MQGKPNNAKIIAEGREKEKEVAIFIVFLHIKVIAQLSEVGVLTGIRPGARVGMGGGACAKETSNAPGQIC